MNLRKNILAYFRHCPVCGSDFGFIDWLCSPCMEIFFRKLKASNKEPRWLKNSIPVYSLLDWPPEDVFTTKLVYSLKGGGLEEAYTMLAELFLLKHQPSLPDHFFYPSKGHEDHAFQWSKALSKSLCLRQSPLVLEQDGKQALKNRGQRQSLCFKGLKIKDNLKPILVDDIVTSGATALAASKALGQPKSFAVWSIFYRRSL